MRRQTELIGLLGGMSWQSTALYYRLLNEAVQREMGEHHNARSVLFTLNYDDLDRLASAGRWDSVGDLIGDTARRVEQAGADFVMITAVTGHAVAEQVETALGVSLLHIADPAAEALRTTGVRRVGLLGTRFTMEMEFFKERLHTRHGLDVVTPTKPRRQELHRIILEELTLGRVEEKSQAAVRDMAADLAAQGAEAVLLACTELPLLMPVGSYPLPAYDVPRLHVEAAVLRALASS